MISCVDRRVCWFRKRQHVNCVAATDENSLYYSGHMLPQIHVTKPLIINMITCISCDINRKITYNENVLSFTRFAGSGLSPNIVDAEKFFQSLAAGLTQPDACLVAPSQYKKAVPVENQGALYCFLDLITLLLLLLLHTNNGFTF